jgi:fumarylacetoacetase
MDAPLVIAESNARHLYWDPCQQLAHHTVGGCNLRPGDLLASGTISGPDARARGSLLELTWRGTEPIKLPSGEERRFLEDGDRLTITGRCAKDGVTLGFGEVTGRVLPAYEGR